MGTLLLNEFNINHKWLPTTNTADYVVFISILTVAKTSWCQESQTQIHSLTQWPIRRMRRYSVISCLMPVSLSITVVAKL